MNLILSIPLGDETEENWYLRHEKLGVYSVNSAYMTLKYARRGNLEDNSGFWRKLWNLKIPPKVKKFLWRSVNNCLPTNIFFVLNRYPLIMFVQSVTKLQSQFCIR